LIDQPAGLKAGELIVVKDVLVAITVGCVEKIEIGKYVPSSLSVENDYLVWISIPLKGL
jgi:hypothetical protein